MLVGLLTQLLLPAALLAYPIVAVDATLQPPRAIDLPGAKLFPESVSIAPDGTAFVGSMSGGIVRISLKTGTSTQFVAPGAFGSGALFGVLADTRNKIVWTCTNDFPGTGVSVTGANAGSWLTGFDIRSGRGKISIKLPGERPMCNDMVVGPSGALYITDTAHPRILRWRPGATALEIWVETDMLGPGPSHGGLDGIALAGDGNLYVNNVRSGALYRVILKKDGSAGAVTELKTSRPLTAPDGMRALSGMDLLLAEGAGRISRVRIDDAAAVVTTLADGIREPTGVDSFGGVGWYVQAHLSVLFRPAAPPPILPFRLTPVALQNR